VSQYTHRARRGRTRVTRLEDAGANRGVYILPNLLTTAGLFCGIFSIAQTLHGFYFNAALAVIGAMVFDILDGRVARLTRTTSRFGEEYDSLCDLVSFGVAPGVLIYVWALIPWAAWGWLATALFVCCAALRLARFNVTATRHDSGFFVGLPVPAAAGSLASIVLMYSYIGRSGLPDKHIALLLVTYALATLMVSTVPYPSFKHLKLHRRQPLWLLVVAILGLKFVIARYELVFFVASAFYLMTGPAVWALRRTRYVYLVSDGPSLDLDDDDDDAETEDDDLTVANG
jgi:CDP-diacylglycerol--serine O-phosphatidyltransferase